MIRKIPAKSFAERVPGLFVVVLLHVGLGWLLYNGLARKAVEQVIKEPLEVALIEAPKPLAIEEPLPPPEPSPPEPPPPPREPPKPKPRPKPAPKPAYVPPAEVPVSAAPAEPTISAVQSVERVPDAAPVAPPPSPPAPPAPPPTVAVGVACPNHVAVRSSVAYPSRAERRGIEGRVIAEFTVSPVGALDNVHIVSSSDVLFNDVVLAAVQRFRCVGQGTPVRVRVPFEFSLN